MPLSNTKIAELLRRYATALNLEGVVRFKTKAYRRAADTIETLPEEVAAMIARGEDLKALPGIGDAISAKVREIVSTGKLSQLDRVLSKLSPELIELAGRPGLDPKRVKRVYKKLGISNLADLERRLESGEIRDKLGSRLEFHIRQGLNDSPRMLLWQADKIVPYVEKLLQAIPGVTRVESVGSVRRRQDTVGNLNFLVSASRRAEVYKRFSEYGELIQPQPRDDHTLAVRFTGGYLVTLHFCKEADWGLNLLSTTGSAAHLRDLRAYAKLNLSERSLGGITEEKQVYRKLGLAFIEPELREGLGEVAAAKAKRLPSLVCADDLRGDLHMHTTASDGANTIEEMAAAAKAKGYQYIAITDHSKSLKITNGLTEKRLLQQIKAIDKLNAKLRNFTRRRIASGFGRLRQQLTGGLSAIAKFQHRWEEDRLHFEGTALGQRIAGRIDVDGNSVRVQLDLPQLLATLADRIRRNLQDQGRLLLEKHCKPDAP